MCSVCGGPVRSDSKHGVCIRTPECMKERERLRRAANSEARAAQWSAWYQKNKSHRREYQRKDRAAKPEVYRARDRSRTINREAHARAIKKYLSWTDRTCRYAHAGCAEFALPGGQTCRAHRTEDNRRHWRAWDARQRESLGERQSWMCVWCSQSIESGAKTDIDHIIPKSSGFVIEEDWNLQLLHSSCNRSKSDRITAQALRLAAAHGIELTLDGDQPMGSSRYECSGAA
jgi:5-methylcytosine-specific restriction endonuclease McrA